MAEQSPGAEHFAVYTEYSKTLRTWLVAYGVGAPVLLLTNERLAKDLAGSPLAPQIAALFLIGVALQVFLSFLNKTVAWVCYWAAINADERPDLKNHWAVARAERVSECYSIDVLIDLASSVLFLYATWQAFGVLFKL